MQFTAMNTIIAEFAQDWASLYRTQLIQLFTDLLPAMQQVTPAKAAQ